MTEAPQPADGAAEELPYEAFEGPIKVVSDPADVSPAVAELRQSAVLGFDTETRPSFKKGEHHAVSLLQLCDGRQAYLFRVQQCGLPDDLCALLSDPGVLKSGVAARDDIKALMRVRPFAPGGFVELQTVARALGAEEMSIKRLAARYLRFQVSKRQRLTNWDAPTLTHPQMVYAATDAWVSYLLHGAMGSPAATPIPLEEKPRPQRRPKPRPKR